MRLLDFQVVLPVGLRLEKESAADDGLCTEFVGAEGQTAIASIVDAAVKAGFLVSHRSAHRAQLERGEQRLILVSDTSGLTIQTYDPTALPAARYEGSALLLADLRVDMKTAFITPLRERRIGNLHRAAWRLRDIGAPQAVQRVIDAVVESKGLKRGALFSPPKGGREVWTGEASSLAELVKVAVTVESDDVLVEIDLVDLRAGAPAHIA